jgi:hypothetical protein
MRFPLFGRRRLRPRDLAPDSYVTDGRALLRIVDRLAAGGSILVSVEDCLTLEPATAAARELEAMGFRPLRPADTRTGRPPSLVPADRSGRAVVH